jgi:hypothetical protein
MRTNAGGSEVEKQESRSTRDIAREIAVGVIHHIDVMYPAMWHHVPSTARLSVKGAIINGIVAEFSHQVELSASR